VKFSKKMRLCQEYVRDGKLLTKKSITHLISQEMVLKTIETCAIMTGVRMNPVHAVMLYVNPETEKKYGLVEAMQIVKEIEL
jgi:hypothetical protein